MPADTPPGREAVLRYLDADFHVLREGDHVRCAVTGKPIRLDDLLYWDVGLQQAYGSAAAAFSRRLSSG